MASYSTLGSNIESLTRQNQATGGYGGGNTALIEMQKAQQQIQNQPVSRPKATTKKTSSGTIQQVEQQVPEMEAKNGYDYAAMMQAMLEQQRAAAEEAYAHSKARLDDAWGDTLTSLANNRNSALQQLQNNYDYTSAQANDDANKSLREAYVNYMLNKKNMNQNLSAMGVSGGASESSLANMYNSYGNARNNINTTLADSLASLLNSYQNNAAGVEQAYNSQYADARNNYMSQLNALESALASNAVSNYSGGNLSNLADYASTLSQLIDNQAQQTYTPTQNILGVNTISTQQGIANDPGTATNYAKWKAMTDDLINAGADASQIITRLQNNGASMQDIFNVFNA